MTENCYRYCDPSLDCDILCSSYQPSPIHLPPPPPPESNGSIHIIAIIVSLAVFGSMFICACHSRQRAAAVASSSPVSPTNNTHEEHDTIHIMTVGLAESVLNSIEVRRYKKGEGDLEGKGCAVCLSEFCDGEDLRVLLECRHAFHVACIDMWLKSHVNCPLCRVNIVPDSTTLTSKEPTAGPNDSAVEPRGGDSPSQGHIR